MNTVTVEIDGKKVQREYYFDTTLEPHRRVQPVLEPGEVLLETIDGRFIIVQGPHHEP